MQDGKLRTVMNSYHFQLWICGCSSGNKCKAVLNGKVFRSI